MLVLLSPAKTLDHTSPAATRRFSQPRMLGCAEELVAILATRTPDDLARLMGISEELAALNARRFADFEAPFTPANARQAVLAFAGDVYQGLDARNRFGARDFTEAQKTIRILSGLYGVLRPLDLIQPYRLEMGTPLTTDRGRTLYDWWGARITDLLAADLADSPGPRVIVNLASQEYYAAVHADDLDADIISPRFESVTASGKRQVVSFTAKRARGLMAAWLVLHRVRRPRRIVDFAEGGFRYDWEASGPGVPVFVRAQN